MSRVPDSAPKAKRDRNRSLARSPTYWLRTMLTFWKLSPWRVGLLVLISVLSSVVPPFQIGMTALAVQSVSDVIDGDSEAMDTVVAVAVAMLVLNLVTHALSSVNGYLTSVLRLELTQKLGLQVMEKGVATNLQTYEDPDAYDRLQRARRESSGGSTFEVFNDMVQVVGSVATLVTVSLLLFSWNPWVALLVLLSPLPSMASSIFFGARSYEVERERTALRRRAYYYHSLATTDISFKEVRMFHLGGELVRRYKDLIGRFFHVDRSIVRRREAWVAGLGLISVLIYCGAMAGALLNSVNTGRIGELAGYLQALGTVQGAAGSLLMTLSSVYRNTLFAGDLFDYLKLPDETTKGGDRPFPEELSEGIEFRRVSFAYPRTSKKVLNDFSAFFPPRSMTALVGPNGTGKSTVIKLLCRLYEPDSGVVLIDGVPIQEYDLDQLQRGIGVIFQDFIKYELTAQENIGFGRLEEMEDTGRIERAGRQSGADEFLSQLPQGYGSQLGRRFEKGQQLSGGQWQKVALSRALMRRAPVMVLDEPTAAIDAQSEAEIFQRIGAVYEGATAVVIAHRFSTVRKADQIIVMGQDGRIAERGTHDELMALAGAYSHLFLLQAEAYQLSGQYRAANEMDSA